MTTRRSAAGRERFNIRLDPEAKERIEQAALFEGKAASSFTLSSALGQAEQTMVLKHQDADAIYDALLQPPRISPKLAAALKEHDRRVSLE